MSFTYIYNDLNPSARIFEKCLLRAGQRTVPGMTQTRAVAYTAGAPRFLLEFVYDNQGRRVQKTVSEWDMHLASGGFSGVTYALFY